MGKKYCPACEIKFGKYIEMEEVWLADMLDHEELGYECPVCNYTITKGDLGEPDEYYGPVDG